jgi:hypothetical protein
MILVPMTLNNLVPLSPCWCCAKDLRVSSTNKRTLLEVLVLSSLSLNIKIRPMHQAKYHPYFFTATCLGWKHLLADDGMKEIIIDSLRFLSRQGSVSVFAFALWRITST